MKRVPKHLRCKGCKGYCDLRTPGTIKIDGVRWHIRCVLAGNPNRRKKRKNRRLTPAEAVQIFGASTSFWEGIREEQLQ